MKPSPASSRPTSRNLALSLAALASILVGCASESPEGTPRHLLPELRVTRDGTRVTLETDLPDPLVAPAIERLDKLELLLDHVFPWLTPSSSRVLVLLIEDEGTYREVAHRHGIQQASVSSFACRSGEVIIRFHAEEWGQGPAEGWVQAPRIAPVAEVLFRRRLEATYGEGLERTALEDGCARLFSEAAAHEFGEAREAQRRTNDDLLDAFLPLFLGAEPVFAKALLTRGNAALPHAAEKSNKPARARSVAYTVARYVVVAGQGDHGAKDFTDVFAAAAGRPGASDALAARAADFASRESGYERWLRGKTTDALLDTLESDPVAAARWEARAALKLIAAVDVELDDSVQPRDRAAVVERARKEVETRKTVRFADEFDGLLLQTRDPQRHGGGLSKLAAEARRVLDERAQGFGHPALEELRHEIGRALEARLKTL